jgi:hypothetical protein
MCLQSTSAVLPHCSSPNVQWLGLRAICRHIDGATAFSPNLTALSLLHSLDSGCAAFESVLAVEVPVLPAEAGKFMWPNAHPSHRACW